jgi:hypothetical protein
VRSDCLSKVRVVGKACGIQSCHIQLYKSLPLFLSDLKMTMHIYQVREPDLAAEAVGPTERFDSESGQIVDVLWLATSEEWLQQRILQEAAVEGVLKSMQRLLSTGEFIERWHPVQVRCDKARVRSQGDEILQPGDLCAHPFVAEVDQSWRIDSRSPGSAGHY